MTASRLLLLVAAVLFLLAGLEALGVLRLISVEALALFGFACWAGSGAV